MLKKMADVVSGGKWVKRDGRRESEAQTASRTAKTGSRTVRRAAREQSSEGESGSENRKSGGATGNKRVKREAQRGSRTAGECLTAIRRCTGDSAGGEPESGRYRNDSRKPENV